MPNNAGGGTGAPSYPNFNDRPGGGNAVNRPGNIGNNVNRPNNIGNNVNRPNNIGNNTNINRNTNINNINAGRFNNNSPTGRSIRTTACVRTTATGITATGTAIGITADGITIRRPGGEQALLRARPWDTRRGTGDTGPITIRIAAPLVVGGTTVDYSQPIVLAQSPAMTTADYAPEAANNGQPAPNDQAMSLFDTARQAFYDQDYPTALKTVEQALAILPNDAVLNEFRGVTLFAMKRYKDAAGVVYAVLSVGPGWDWTTLSALYANVDTYTEQLRALRDYVRANPNDPAARFLLAYQYLTCGSNDAAAAQLKEVVKLNPQDALSAQLLQGLGDKEPPAAAEQPRPRSRPSLSRPQSGGQLESQPAGRFELRPDACADGKFTWKFTQKDKMQQFSGPYTMADNLLILTQNENPVMVGQAAMLDGGKFNFKLPGENPADPGLTFSK